MPTQNLVDRINEYGYDQTPLRSREVDDGSVHSLRDLALDGLTLVASILLAVVAAWLIVSI